MKFTTVTEVGELKHLDGEEGIYGDVIPLKLACGHSTYGNFIYHYEVGTRLACRKDHS